ncbi:MAG: SAM-dependent methyltransferase [Magnetococcales bacterium]|nr:SAM-dependent methyltransferase [Magnetococcales bacterium]
MNDSPDPLARLLADLAGEAGIVPFWRVMELALYHPEHGYYMTGRQRIGREGDFVTAPELTSLFGELLTLQCIEVWELLGRPHPFAVIEMGGGSGRLAADFLATARRFVDFFQALAYRVVEISPDFRARQQELVHALGCGAEKISWSATLPDHIEAGVILGNEFLDALPVHWVEMTPHGLMEVGLVPDGQGTFTTLLVAPQSPLAPDYFDNLGIDLATGYRTEVGLAAARWMEGAGRALGRGVVLMIDYGWPASEYYAPHRTHGTLAGHRGHERVDDPLRFLGTMDLTAHVDFSAMARAGTSAGLTPLGFTTQAWFLMGLGILERLQRLTGRLAPEQAESLRQAVMRLILPDAMGERFKVLAMGKGVLQGALSGFRLNDQWPRL